MLNFINLLNTIPPPLGVKVRALGKANKRNIAAEYGVFFNKTMHFDELKQNKTNKINECL